MNEFFRDPAVAVAAHRRGNRTAYPGSLCSRNQSSTEMGLHNLSLTLDLPFTLTEPSYYAQQHWTVLQDLMNQEDEPFGNVRGVLEVASNTRTANMQQQGSYDVRNNLDMMKTGSRNTKQPDFSQFANETPHVVDTQLEVGTKSINNTIYLSEFDLLSVDEGPVTEDELMEMNIRKFDPETSRIFENLENRTDTAVIFTEVLKESTVNGVHETPEEPLVIPMEVEANPQLDPSDFEICTHIDVNAEKTLQLPSVAPVLEPVVEQPCEWGLQSPEIGHLQHSPRHHITFGTSQKPKATAAVLPTVVPVFSPVVKEPQQPHSMRPENDQWQQFSLGTSQNPEANLLFLSSVAPLVDPVMEQPCSKGPENGQRQPTVWKYSEATLSISSTVAPVLDPVVEQPRKRGQGLGTSQETCQARKRGVANEAWLLSQVDDFRAVAGSSGLQGTPAVNPVPATSRQSSIDVVLQERRCKTDSRQRIYAISEESESEGSDQEYSPVQGSRKIAMKATGRGKRNTSSVISPEDRRARNNLSSQISRNNRKKREQEKEEEKARLQNRKEKCLMPKIQKQEYVLEYLKMKVTECNKTVFFTDLV